jgi:hypothetical protein
MIIPLLHQKKYIWLVGTLLYLIIGEFIARQQLYFDFWLALFWPLHFMGNLWSESWGGLGFLIFIFHPLFWLGLFAFFGFVAILFIAKTRKKNQDGAKINQHQTVYRLIACTYILLGLFLLILLSSAELGVFAPLMLFLLLIGFGIWTRRIWAFILGLIVNVLALFVALILYADLLNNPCEAEGLGCIGVIFIGGFIYLIFGVSILLNIFLWLFLTEGMRRISNRLRFGVVVFFLAMLVLGMIFEFVRVRNEQTELSRVKEEVTLPAARDDSRIVEMAQLYSAMQIHWTDYGEFAVASSLEEALMLMDYVYLDGDRGNGPCEEYRWIPNLDDSSRYCAYACLERGGYYAVSNKGSKELFAEPTTLECWDE